MPGSTNRQGHERRSSTRAALHLPIRVEGYRPNGESWTLTSTTLDASVAGARFAVDREVRIGHALLLNLPMPRTLRDRDHWDANYETWALVRHVERVSEGSWEVGVVFYGKKPPRGFEQSPGARFLLPQDVPSVAPEPLAPGEGETSHGSAPEEPGTAGPPPEGMPDRQRSEQRYEIFVNLTLQEMDEFGAVLREEVTVAENMSLSGARVMTSQRYATGDILLLLELEGGFECRAEVRHTWIGADRIRRLNLKFLDGRQPKNLLQRS